MQEDFDLVHHVNVFSQVISNLARLDDEIEDEDETMILLYSLPSSFEHLITTLTYGKDTIKFNEIHAFVLAHNQWKQNAGEGSHGDSMYVNGNQDPGRKQEKVNFKKRDSKLNSKTSKEIQCYKYKEVGYMKIYCPKLRKYQKFTNVVHGGGLKLQ